MPADNLSSSPPLVFQPLSKPHGQTVILLHGRGRTAEDFASAVLDTPIHDIPNLTLNTDSPAPVSTSPLASPRTTLRQSLPHTKFIFPVAPRQRATVYKRSLVRQWFDDWHLVPRERDVVDARYDDGLQIVGLGDTVAYLHGLVVSEAARLPGGARDVVLGGFSQGGAASLVAALLWGGCREGEEEPLGGIVGLSSWLPYRMQMLDVLEMGVGDGWGEEVGCADAVDGAVEDDLFERSGADEQGEDGGSERGSAHDAFEWLREEIELPDKRRGGYSVGRNSTSVILCHGLDDVKVEPERSLEACSVLTGLGMDHLSRRTYTDVGHDLSDKMLSDVLDFLRHIRGRS